MFNVVVGVERKGGVVMTWTHHNLKEPPPEGQKYEWSKFLTYVHDHKLPDSGYFWAIWCVAYRLGQNKGIVECRKCVRTAQDCMKDLKV